MITDFYLHPHVYTQVEWIILAFIVQPQIISDLWHSFPIVLHCISEETTPSHYFCSTQSKWTDFTKFGTHNLEDIWHWFLCTYPPHVKNIAHYLVKCRTFCTWSKLYDFLPKLDNYENNWLFFVQKLEFQETSVREAVKSYYHLHIFWCCSSVMLCQHSAQELSQQRADAAARDVMHIMLFHCIWLIYQTVL